MVATYTQVMPPIDVSALQVPPQPKLWECQPPLLKIPKGRLQTAHITAEEQQARRAAHAGALSDILNHIQATASAERRATMF